MDDPETFGTATSDGETVVRSGTHEPHRSTCPRYFLNRRDWCSRAWCDCKKDESGAK